MIRAVADYVDDQSLPIADQTLPPPPELITYWNLVTFGLAPNGGGTLDQPAGALLRASAAGNVYQAWKGFNSTAKIVQWQRDNPELWKICVKIMKLRKDGD